MKYEDQDKDKKLKLKFGIPLDLYMKAEAASGLQSIYDLGDEDGEEAYSLADKFKISLEDAFKIIWLLKVEREEEK